jgi:hypothetical protein
MLIYGILGIVVIPCNKMSILKGGGMGKKLVETPQPKQVPVEIPVVVPPKEPAPLELVAVLGTHAAKFLINKHLPPMELLDAIHSLAPGIPFNRKFVVEAGTEAIFEIGWMKDLGFDLKWNPFQGRDHFTVRLV